MNKYEYEIQKLAAAGHNLDRKLFFVASLFKYSVVAFLGYWLFDTVRALGTMEPASLAGLAAVVEKMNFGTVVHSIVTLALGGAWLYERKGKHRAIRKADDFRGQIESGDAYSPSSRLDEIGQTPK